MKPNKSEVVLAFDKGSVRRVDTDGRLFLESSHISKAGVNPYYGREIPKWDELGLDPDKVYQVFRPPEELEASAHTFNNIPILAVHTHVTAENPKKEVIIGSTGNSATFNGEYLDNGLGFWDADYIDKIDTDEQRQLSASYRYIPVLIKGAYNGTPYDIKMTQIEGNHVALVVEGRAGPDVLVADSKLHHPVKVKTVKLNPKQKAALKAHMPKLKVAMDEGIDTEGVESALEQALEEVQALGETTDTTTDADAGSAEIVALLKQIMEKMEGTSTAAADETAKTAEEAKKAEAAKNASAMDEKIKSATDGVKASIEGRFKAAEKVAPLVGKLDAMAFDSAEAIFAHALKTSGMKPEDHAAPAYAGIVEVLIQQKSATPHYVANDEKNAGELLTTFGALANIRQA
ncbi:hypothetical protein AX768_09150 [Burkholderia sp. PAMC 28687]|uniref:DUF2213 domain-containing protein n=1 Tax=Burkholderia sp. PAMC 28687 TaxID=1795874 RepID=UPI0007810F72|nr:DUF2213 domain-containing protein [Burkholderia sp. PAMC 28687]AMM14235.1 hypothetical protein AX768_09150 [Burkholderia sp. PAMC 28687]